jgi:hypothetical protein
MKRYFGSTLAKINRNDTTNFRGKVLSLDCFGKLTCARRISTQRKPNADTQSFSPEIGRRMKDRFEQSFIGLSRSW